MTLNIGGGGEMKPYVKYNAKADKWFTKGKDGDVEIQRPTFLADFGNIQTGWMLFKEGMAPSKVLDASLSTPAEKPSPEHKRGFILHVFSPKFFNGSAELASASIHMGNAVREVYDEYMRTKGAIIGDQVPVIACTGSAAMKDKFGTNYKPKLEIKEWVMRPDAMKADVTVATVSAYQHLDAEPETGKPKSVTDDEIPF